jgi:mono/diheme cytochrome c family protein
VGLGLVIVGLGALLWFGGVIPRPPAPEEIDARRNPVPSTPESVSRGARVYQSYCAVCHGADGRGDGPAAATLYPRPVDFWAHFGSGHTHPDGRLYYWISNGMTGTGMPAFGTHLSEEDRWDVIIDN